MAVCLRLEQLNLPRMNGKLVQNGPAPAKLCSCITRHSSHRKTSGRQSSRGQNILESEVSNEALVEHGANGPPMRETACLQRRLEFIDQNCCSECCLRQQPGTGSTNHAGTTYMLPQQQSVSELTNCAGSVSAVTPLGCSPCTDTTVTGYAKRRC